MDQHDTPPSISDLVSHEQPDFGEAVIAVVTADTHRLRQALNDSPDLVRTHSRSDHKSTLLHYVASNGIEDELQLSPQSIYMVLQRCSPSERENAVQRALETPRILLDAGADIDAIADTSAGDQYQTSLNWLVSSGHPMAAGVMRELSELFCDSGANVDGLAGDSSPMITALAFGNPAAVDVLVRRGCRTDNLILASAAGNLDAVKSYCVDDGFSSGDIARCKFSWFTPPDNDVQVAELALVFAAMCGRVDVVRYMIEAGLDKDAIPPGTHMTSAPLHTACLNGQVETVDALIELGCDPTLIEPRYKGNAAGWAHEGGNPHVIQRIGQYLPEFLRKTKGKTPEVKAFVSAIFSGEVEKVQQSLAAMPLTHTQLDGPWFYFDTPAVVQAKSNLPIVDCLIAAGANINQKSHWWAGGFGVLDGTDHELAEQLIERGAKLDVWSAAELGRLSQLQSMIDADSTLVNARGPDGKTPLHCAKSVSAAKYLLSQGADCNAKCVDHESTAVQYLVAKHPDVARCLIDHGCRADIMAAAALGDNELARTILSDDPTAISMIVDRQNFPSAAADCIYSWTLGWYLTPHQIADKFGHAATVQFLLDKSPTPTKLLNALLLGNEQCVQTLISESPTAQQELSAVEHQHVAHAARNNQTEMVTRLLTAGFPVDARGQHQATPLHFATFHGNCAMAKVILNHQPSLEATDADFGSTPLGWAREGCQNGWHKDTGDYPGVIKLLLTAGAQVDPLWNPTGHHQVDELFAN